MCDSVEATQVFEEVFMFVFVFIYQLARHPEPIPDLIRDGMAAGEGVSSEVAAPEVIGTERPQLCTSRGSFSKTASTSSRLVLLFRRFWPANRAKVGRFWPRRWVFDTE